MQVWISSRLESLSFRLHNLIKKLAVGRRPQPKCTVVIDIHQNNSVVKIDKLSYWKDTSLRLLVLFTAKEWRVEWAKQSQKDWTQSFMKLFRRAIHSVPLPIKQKKKTIFSKFASSWVLHDVAITTTTKKKSIRFSANSNLVLEIPPFFFLKSKLKRFQICINISPLPFFSDIMK